MRSPACLLSFLAIATLALPAIAAEPVLITTADLDAAIDRLPRIAEREPIEARLVELPVRSGSDPELLRSRSVPRLPAGTRAATSRPGG
ncbi:MAG: hypothetical protein JXR96_05035 [Deltaproteobacteria bacterium]|nr:hypothetical protein [Deltaproteobacteria bacterium]